MSQTIIDLVNAAVEDQRPSPGDLRGYYVDGCLPLLACEGDPGEALAWRTITPLEALRLYGASYQRPCPCGCKRRSAQATVEEYIRPGPGGKWESRWRLLTATPAPSYDGPFLTVPTRTLEG